MWLTCKHYELWLGLLVFLTGQYIIQDERSQHMVTKLNFLVQFIFYMAFLAFALMPTAGKSVNIKMST